jgi:hypothetical protein
MTMTRTSAKRSTAKKIASKLGKRRAKPRLTPVREIPAYAVIIRAIHERGRTQREAFSELERRGLWLGPDQMRQSRLTPKELDAELRLGGK